MLKVDDSINEALGLLGADVVLDEGSHLVEVEFVLALRVAHVEELFVPQQLEKHLLVVPL
eukprot:CAMPEP_0185592692 /NCGR_PEP_ID=MMETSP0434-20130131/68790_1 /TAXON_ID=626734 ORGANISM="Favella taraikaensis, Strain Fe Narragansett Bay" /NCGR_SAMPLE_ID=MMETSP0434 /ASSEMBLY_ACC=CAM_ASM_000379 /LENGTH=59 /DNA_ID=CAMNT_0028218685 /DNA_START=1456 /DNA_END=1632 /DNA_ORIENTATION=-